MYRPHSSSIILLSIVICLAASVDAKQDANNAAPGWNPHIETVARGVDSWCSSVQTIEGISTAQVYVSDAEIDSQRRADDTEIQSPGKRPKYTKRGLYVCQFFLGADEWYTQLAEVVPTGANHWGMAIHGAPGKDISEIESAKACPVSYSLCDREKVVVYHSKAGFCRIAAYQKTDAEGQPMSEIKASLLLTAANVPLGQALLKLIHSKYSSFPTKLVSAFKGEEVEGVECWKLSIYFQTTPDNLIRYSVWVAPKRDYMPMAFESFLVEKDNRRKGMRHYYKVTEAQEIKQGIWIPTQSSYHWFVYEPGRNSNWYRGYQVNFADLQINQTKPSFELIPPLGIIIQDLRPEVMAQRQLGGLEKALRDFKSATPLQPEPSVDGPLTGKEFDDVFPRN